MTASPLEAASIDCKPLLASAHATLYLENPFRITGLPVFASAKDISRHADKLKILEELGQGAESRTAAFALTPAPSTDQVREAIVRLKDPERRIVDEFFWFWPESDEGCSEDAALQALTRGDQNLAHRTWCDRLQDPAAGFVAGHNLAILYHLVALDWTHYHLAEALPAQREDKIKWYWEESFKHWRAVASNDRVWDRVRSRIRAIDDARLTSGFVRRMEGMLPRALNIVSGEVAVKFAQSGNLDWARIHVRFIGEKRDELTKTAETVLEPLNTRLRHQIQEAQSTTDKNPKQGSYAAGQLLDQCAPQLSLFELFYENNAHQKNDLFDDAALTCMRCLISYQNATHDNQTFVELLRRAHATAASDETRQRVQEQIEAGEIILQRKALAPVYEKFKAIPSPKAKLDFVKKEMMPRLAAVIQQHGSGAPQARSLSDAAAELLRTLSLEACNDHDDLETAQAACDLALKLCQSTTLKARLIEDQTALRKIASEAKQHNILLSIRKDEIEANESFVRYNRTKILVADVTHVRYGVLRQYTNGVQSGSSYLFEIKSRHQEHIRIECKRMFRSDQEAQLDYNAIFSALSYHIFSALAIRIAKDVVRGSNWQLGASVFQRDGAMITTGSLWWEKQHFVAYEKLQSRHLPGAIQILSRDDPKINTSYSLRTIWNAGVIEQVVRAITQLRTSSV